MIKGIGVDVVELDRFKKISSDQDFIRQIFNDQEILTILHNDKNPHLQIAKVFAIKEALLKALGTGLNYGFYWHNIEISPCWEIKLHGFLKDVYQKLCVNKIDYSVSYTKKFLTAIVILE